MSDVVRAVLVGAGGYAAANVVPFIPAMRNLEYVAVCDANLEAARAAAARIGAPLATADFAEVLARPDVRMVELHTPNDLHAGQTEAATAAGKHVLCQKPMATSLAEARAMIRAARRAGRLLGIYLDGYHDPFLWDLKAAIEAGLLGRVVGFRLRYAHQGGLGLRPEAWRRSLDRVGGGCFLLLAVHLVNAVQWLLGARVTRVTGFMKTLLAPMEGDDSTAGALELDNGLVGAAEASYVAAGAPDIPNTVPEVRGTEGAVRYQRDDGVLYVYAKAGAFRGEAIVYDRPGETLRFTRDTLAYRRPTVQERFASAILGGEPYLAPGEVGLRDLAVCLAMAESARTGRAVDLDAFLGEPP